MPVIPFIPIKKLIMETMKKYKNHSKLIILRKPKSGHRIMICSNDKPDYWLFDIIRFRKKDRKIIEDGYIIKKDLIKHLHYLKNQGYQIPFIRIHNEIKINKVVEKLIHEMKCVI